MAIDLQPEIESVKAWLLKRAQEANRADVEDYLGHMKFEEVYEMMVRYARQRMLGLIGMETLKPKEQTVHERAFNSFHSEICPGCEGPKKREYWFCNQTCWPKIPQVLKPKFYHGYKVTVLQYYLEALSILRKG